MTTAYSYIRFSSKRQILGDSLTRQIRETAAYAAKQGWELDTSIRPDKGISAAKGLHRIKGNLKAFFDKVKNGEIAKGSWLIVEAMDRLGRDQISDATQAFLEIINADIGIVTLMDNGRQYTRETINADPMQLQYSIMAMTQANAYVVHLSGRISSAWKTKHEDQAAGEVVPIKLPFWISRTDTAAVAVMSCVDLLSKGVRNVVVHLIPPIHAPIAVHNLPSYS